MELVFKMQVLRNAKARPGDQMQREGRSARSARARPAPLVASKPSTSHPVTVEILRRRFRRYGAGTAPEDTVLHDGRC